MRPSEAELLRDTPGGSGSLPAGGRPILNAASSILGGMASTASAYRPGEGGRFVAETRMKPVGRLLLLGIESWPSKGDSNISIGSLLVCPIFSRLSCSCWNVVDCLSGEFRDEGMSLVDVAVGAAIRRARPTGIRDW